MKLRHKLDVIVQIVLIFQNQLLTVSESNKINKLDKNYFLVYFNGILLKCGT